MDLSNFPDRIAELDSLIDKSKQAVKQLVKKSVDFPTMTAGLSKIESLIDCRVKLELERYSLTFLKK